MNAIGYIRISPYLHTIGDQEISIRNFCVAKGLNLLMMFKDLGVYNEDRERESWLAVEEYVRLNGNVQFLLFVLPAKITKYNKLIDDVQTHFRRHYNVLLIAVE